MLAAMRIGKGKIWRGAHVMTSGTFFHGPASSHPKEDLRKPVTGSAENQSWKNGLNIFSYPIVVSGPWPG
jgi:hypothetical protein